jgi:hypothetical protein
MKVLRKEIFCERITKVSLMLSRCLYDYWTAYVVSEMTEMLAYIVFIHSLHFTNYILVAGGGGRARKETAGSRIDDGSMYGDGAVYDDRDPNYDSEEETLEEKIKYLPPATLRRAVGNASMTLTKYKVID